MKHKRLTVLLLVQNSANFERGRMQIQQYGVEAAK